MSGLGAIAVTLTGCSWGSGDHGDPITAASAPFICEGLLSKAAVTKAAGGTDLRSAVVRGPDDPGMSCWVDEGGKNAIQLEVNRSGSAERSWTAEKARQDRDPEPMPAYGGEEYVAPEGRVAFHRNGLYVSLWITKDVDGRDRIKDAKALVRLMLPRIEITPTSPTPTRTRAASSGAPAGVGSRSPG